MGKDVREQSREAVVARICAAQARFNLSEHLMTQNLANILTVSAQGYARPPLFGPVSDNSRFANHWRGPLHWRQRNTACIFTLSLHEDLDASARVLSSVFQFKRPFQYELSRTQIPTHLSEIQPRSTKRLAPGIAFPSLLACLQGIPTGWPH